MGQPLQLLQIQLFCVLLENLGSFIRVWKSEFDAEVQPREHGWVDHLLFIGRTNEQDVIVALKTVYFSQQNRDQSLGHLMVVFVVSSSGQGIDLIYEDDALPQLRGLLKD